MVVEIEMFKIKLMADFVLGKNLFQLCNLFDVSSHGKEGTFLSSSSCKAFISITKALPA